MEGAVVAAAAGALPVGEADAFEKEQSAPRLNPRDAPTKFDREWDSALSLIRKYRTDIAKKTLGETAQGKVRGSIPRWGSKKFTEAGALKLG